MGSGGGVGLGWRAVWRAVWPPPRPRMGRKSGSGRSGRSAPPQPPPRVAPVTGTLAMTRVTTVTTGEAFFSTEFSPHAHLCLYTPICVLYTPRLCSQRATHAHSVDHMSHSQSIPTHHPIPCPRFDPQQQRRERRRMGRRRRRQPQAPLRIASQKGGLSSRRCVRCRTKRRSGQSG